MTGRTGLALALGFWLVSSRAGAGDEPGYVAIDRLNVGLPKPATPPDLETPQSSLENFVLAGERKNFRQAARSMNLNGIEPALQPVVGPDLARQLKSVMDQQLWFHWGDVPDRPDGVDDDAPVFPGESGATREPRSTLKLGSLYVGDIDVEIRLERVKPPDGRPVWVFSRQTVEHVRDLYRHYGPGPLEAAVPAVLRETKIGRVAVWQWAGFVVTLVTGGLLGWLMQKALNAALRWTPSAWARTTAEAIRGPGALTIGLWISHYLVRKFLGLAGPVLSLLEPLYAAVIVAGLVWFLQRLINMISARVCQRYESHGSDDANALLTRITVARHLLTVLVLIVGGAYALSRFEWFRQMGMTLLASAGVAGLILGIAAQRMLGNLFAGFVLALTQPVKTGDAILFEGEFGWIEEIAITYLVIRSWDLRRIVVPITYFLDHPFQNWSRRSQQLMMPVYVYADYRIDVEAVRAEFKTILESAADWDKTVPPILQVTACKEDMIELRALCSAGNPAASWNLQCLVRERLSSFIRDLDGGRYLPRRRVALVEDLAPAPRPVSANGQGQPPRNGQPGAAPAPEPVAAEAMGPTAPDAWPAGPPQGR